MTPSPPRTQCTDIYDMRSLSRTALQHEQINTTNPVQLFQKPEL
uniref:Uncharacterized protein n=1 Tax=Anguilla anguilla TaxID=7936 RepID=A0A0E9QC11_ANGAN